PIDTLLFGPQEPDVSQGRSPDSSANYQWFADPTPGQSNPYEGTIIVASETLVPYGQSWSYNQDNQPLDSSWMTPSYNDNTWPAGPALLYVESSGLPGAKNTPLTLGARTYYFRTQFILDQNLSEITALALSTILDDGAILYLNGQEILRLGMPNSNVGHETLANRSVGNAEIEGPFEFDSSLLIQGTNTLAVEVHQTSSGSSDIVFGLRLDALTQTKDN
ncbi:MAG: hypothetical protein HQ515_21640, partial [Phycisphaeraceae bacterium]|nr:hypothetical protein [Phycisphaeraceae bacterium]